MVDNSKPKACESPKIILSFMNLNNNNNNKYYLNKNHQIYNQWIYQYYRKIFN